MSTHDTRASLLSNADGQVVHSGREVLARLVKQVSSPVRWDLCMQTMLDLGVTGLIEIPPAGTLVGLAKRGMPGVETLALKTPDDIQAAHRMIREHGGVGSDESHDESPTWRLVIAPSKGSVELESVAVGDTIAPGAVVARVSTLRDTYDVTAPHGGQVIEWLVENGDPVSPGQPLLRLHPIS